MAEELTIIVRAKDWATTELNKIRKGINTLSGHVLSLRGALAGAAGVWAGMRFMDYASKVESVGLGFENLTEKIGGSTKILEALRRGTKETVSDFRLMEAANRAMMFGVGKSAEEFELLATVARRLGRAVGRDTTDALNDMFIGIGRQSRLFLDNIGLIVKVADANRKMAASLGKTVEALTDAEKRQAFWNATLEAARGISKKLGPDVYLLADAWQQFKTSIENAANEVIGTLTPALKDLFKTSGTWVKENKPEILGFFASLIEYTGHFATILAETAYIVDSFGSDISKLLLDWEYIKSKFVVGFYDLLGTPDEETAEWVEWHRDYANRIFGEIGKAENLATKKLRDSANSILQSTKQVSKRIHAEIEREQREHVNRLISQIEESNRIWQQWGGRKPMEIAEVPLMDSREMVLLRSDLIEGLKTEVEIQRELNKEIERENHHLYRLTKDWEDKRDAMRGVTLAFQEMKLKSEEWGTVFHDGIIAMTEALGSGLVDGIMAIGENFREAGKAAREMTISILKDLARIALQLTVMQGLQMALGGLFGGVASSTNVGLGPGMMPFKFRQHGGYIPRNELALVGEAGPEIVRLPGGSRVYPNEALGGTVNVTIHNHNPQFRTPEQERAFTRTQQDQIRAIVVQAKNSSINFAEAMA